MAKRPYETTKAMEIVDGKGSLGEQMKYAFKSSKKAADGEFEKKLRACQNALKETDYSEKFGIINDFLSTNAIKQLAKAELHSASHYAIPEICITKAEYKDYILDIKAAITIGILEAVKRFDIDKVERMESGSYIKAFVAYSRGYIRFERCRGKFSALNKLKEKYEDCSEYYATILIKAHKNGLDDIRAKRIEEIMKFLPSHSKITATRMKEIFSKEISNIGLDAASNIEYINTDSREEQMFDALFAKGIAAELFTLDETATIKSNFNNGKTKISNRILMKVAKFYEELSQSEEIA